MNLLRNAVLKALLKGSILMLAGCSVLVRLITMHTWAGSQVVPNDRCFEMQLKIKYRVIDGRACHTGMRTYVGTDVPQKF